MNVRMLQESDGVLPMIKNRTTIACFLLTVFLVSASPIQGQSREAMSQQFAETFDAHWQKLNDNYPYFDLYEVDWKAEREEHRLRATAAENPSEFAWELARMIGALPDPHVSFMPSIKTIKGKWSYPKLDIQFARDRILVTGWPEGQSPKVPASFAKSPHAYPEVVAIRGQACNEVANILAAGPLGTSFNVRLRWPDGSETDHELRRPKTSNLPPTKKHFGKRWLVTGRAGSIGYMRIKTFSPKKTTSGSSGKMTTMLRAALAKLRDTKGLILDLQGNGGGVVTASDPFLGNFLEEPISYRWGNSGGQSRVLTPRKPHYPGRIVVIVDGRSASGGEWAARILRDAKRATVIGGPTLGAEAAVGKSTGADGSVVRFSRWPMAEPGVKPFQATGVDLDHGIPLTVEAIRASGAKRAIAQVRRARYGKALEVLGAPAEDLDALVKLADAADAEAESR